MEDSEECEKSDAKRKCRNLSEKKRRDQFNLLINELESLVSVNSQKMDKSAVLKATISIFKSQKDFSSKRDDQKVHDDWQPSFLSNEEFSHLMLEALDGFILALSGSGLILYTSESITPLLGHVPSEVSGTDLCDLMLAEDQGEMRKFLSNPALVPWVDSRPNDYRERYTIGIRIQRGPISSTAAVYERIRLRGYFKKCKSSIEDGSMDFSCSESDDLVSTASEKTSSTTYDQSPPPFDTKVFVAIARLEQPQFQREMIIFESTKREFTSRHSLEWKFLFLDHRATSIIGYIPLEVLGTSGFDYYHVDDLEKVSHCHEVLMKKGKGTSCFYRFLTKGQQWIWLRSYYYITFHECNSKPEFIVSTNTVVSYNDIRNDSMTKEQEEVKLEMECHNSAESDLTCHESDGSIDQNPTLNETFSSQEDNDSRTIPFNVQLLQFHSSTRENQQQFGAYCSEHSVDGDLSYQHQPKIEEELPTRCSKSPTSSCSTLSSYSVPLVNVESSREPLLWSGTKSISSPCIPCSSQSYGWSPSDISCLQLSHRQHHSCSYSSNPALQSLQRQGESFQKDRLIATSPSSNISVNFEEPQISECSVQQHESIVMKYEQQQLHEELKRKHYELQKNIIRQQEELRKINQQLIMAQYGGHVQVQKDMQYCSRENQYPSCINDINTSREFIANMGAGSLSYMQSETSVSMAGTSGAAFQQHPGSSSVFQQSFSTSNNEGISVQEMAAPYQLSQQETQMHFTAERQSPSSSYPHLGQHRQRHQHSQQ